MIVVAPTATTTFTHADVAERWRSTWRITPLAILAWLVDVGFVDVVDEDGEALVFGVTEKGLEASRALRWASGLDEEGDE